MGPWDPPLSIHLHHPRQSRQGPCPPAHIWPFICPNYDQKTLTAFSSAFWAAPNTWGFHVHDITFLQIHPGPRAPISLVQTCWFTPELSRECPYEFPLPSSLGPWKLVHPVLGCLVQIIQLAGMVPVIILNLLIPSRTCTASLTVETPSHLGYDKLYTVSSLILRTSVNSASPTKFTLPIGVKPGVAVSSCCLFYPLELILADQSQICQIPWISSDGTSQLMSAWVWTFFLSLVFWLWASWGIPNTHAGPPLGQRPLLSFSKCLPDASMHQ